MLTEVAGEIVLPKIMASMIDSGIGAEVAGLGTGYILSRALLMIACIGIDRIAVKNRVSAIWCNAEKT